MILAVLIAQSAAAAEFCYDPIEQDDKVWEQTKTSDTNQTRTSDIIQAYIDYTRRCPNGMFHSEARARLGQLGFAPVESRPAVGRDSPMRNNPTTSAPNPGVVGDEDTETRLWVSARQSNSINGFKEYLSKYPNGEFSSLARARIEVLNGTP